MVQIAQRAGMIEDHTGIRKYICDTTLVGWYQQNPPLQGYQQRKDRDLDLG